MFALAPCVPDDVLDTGPLLALGEGDVGGALGFYVFELDTGGDQGYGLALGVASLLNHAAAPNAMVVVDVESLSYELVAIAPIATDDEVTIDYGPYYDLPG